MAEEITRPGTEEREHFKSIANPISYARIANKWAEGKWAKKFILNANYETRNEWRFMQSLLHTFCSPFSRIYGNKNPLLHQRYATRRSDWQLNFPHHQRLRTFSIKTENLSSCFDWQISSVSAKINRMKLCIVNQAGRQRSFPTARADISNCFPITCIRLIWKSSIGNELNSKIDSRKSMEPNHLYITGNGSDCLKQSLVPSNAVLVAPSRETIYRHKLVDGEKCWAWSCSLFRWQWKRTKRLQFSISIIFSNIRIGSH